MNLSILIGAAKERGASDIHLETSLPAALRVSSSLQVFAEPITASDMRDMALEVVGDDLWPEFMDRGSFDHSKTIDGVRCRINVLKTARGLGMAIRLLSSFQASIERLNLHPDLKKLVANQHGLILVSGPTGSGKSSTMAALIHEINLTESRHIITVEQPIEYQFKPVKSFIRQREVGRDTPSFEQALIDAMREDPDVLMVGEMREPETMRLTLNASETGHLVLATIHSASAAEALQRMVAAFPSEIQNGICAQLADTLVAVVCQRLRFNPELNVRLPECEILRPTHAVKNFIRRNEFHQVISSMETGADHGMWTFARYRSWMSNRRDWYIPSAQPKDHSAAEDWSAPNIAPVKGTPVVPKTGKRTSEAIPGSAGRIEIEPDDGGFEKILKKLT
jgi:twitching motility protein PilT